MGMAFSWNEELMRWLLVALAYVGASVAMRTRNHVGVEFFIMQMKKPVRRTMIILGYAAACVFLAIVLVYGFQTAMNARRQYGVVLRVPMMYVKMNLPLGSLLMFIHILYFGAGIIKEKDDLGQYMITGGERELD
jgi:TRAP-type C4-dicarboxylate transport system permease small subunit